MTEPAALPDEISALKALIEAQRVEIAHLKLLVAKRIRVGGGAEFRADEDRGAFFDRINGTDRILAFAVIP